VRGRADRAQERERLAVAAHHQVLAVVDLALGDGVLKRAGATTTDLAGLDDGHQTAGLGEPHGGRQSGEAASDDDRSRSAEHARAQGTARSPAIRWPGSHRDEVAANWTFT